jgi:hypothetical protein
MVSVFCFVSESLIISQPFPVIGQVVTELSGSLLISDYLQNCHCDTPLPVREKERLDIASEDCFLLARFAKNISSRPVFLNLFKPKDQ